MNKEKYCISTNYTLRDAMKFIDTNAEQFAVALNADETIAGVITDGNIRRAIINGANLDDCVTKIMQKNFTSYTKATNASQALAIMEEKDFSHLPIVDVHGKLYAVWNRKELQNKTPLPHAVVIMAGGLGTRLGALTQELPKPMLPVAGRPILEIVLESFRRVGFQNFYIALNYKAEVISDYFGDGNKFNCNIQYLHEKKRLGTAGALSLLPRQEHDFIVSNGDILTHVNPRHLLLHHIVMRSSATMLAKRYSMQVPYGVIDTNEQGELVDIREKPIFDFRVSAGMNVISPEAVKYIPHDDFFDMPELFKTLMAKKEKTQLFETDAYWLDVGQVPDYEKAQREFN